MSSGRLMLCFRWWGANYDSFNEHGAVFIPEEWAKVKWLKGKYMPTKGSLKGLLKDKLETLDLPFGTFDSWLILWPIVIPEIASRPFY